MKILSYLFFIFALTISLFADAKSRSQTKMAQNSSIQIQVTHGDKITHFLISKTKKGALIKFSNNLGDNASKEISTDDFKFLQSKLSENGKSNEIQFCPRTYIEVTQGHMRKIGCLEANNQVAKNFRETTNLLSLFF